MLQIQNISFVLAPCPLRARDIEHSGGPRNRSRRAQWNRQNHAAEADPRGHHARQWINRNVTPGQEAPAGRTSLLDTVLAADTERESLLRESETATDPARIADIHAVSGHGRSFSAARAAAILSGWVLTRTRNTVPAAIFGWLADARRLGSNSFYAADIASFGRPTNHLDLEAVLWLESHLAKWQGSILLVSHERRTQPGGKGNRTSREYKTYALCGIR